MIKIQYGILFAGMVLLLFIASIATAANTGKMGAPESQKAPAVEVEQQMQEVSRDRLQSKDKVEAEPVMTQERKQDQSRKQTQSNK